LIGRLTMSLAIVGCTVVDVIFARVPRLPVWPRHTEFTATNLVLLEHGPIVTLGGNGANAAYVAAATGANTVLHTRIGDDALGGLARGWLRRAGCRIEAKGGGSTAINVTAANDRLERTSMFHPGEPVMMPRTITGRGAPTHLFVCGWPHPPPFGSRLRAVAAYLRPSMPGQSWVAHGRGPNCGPCWRGSIFSWGMSTRRCG
jgi:ribokinase